MIELRLDPRRLRHLAEGRPFAAARTEVEVETIRDRRGGWTGSRPIELGDRGVHVGVSGDEQIGAAVAVHVSDRGACVPGEAGDPRLLGAVGEVAVALVPEEGVRADRRHVEIGAPVAVEVGGDAAVAAELRDPRPIPC